MLRLCQTATVLEEDTPLLLINGHRRKPGGRKPMRRSTEHTTEFLKSARGMDGDLGWACVLSGEASGALEGRKRALEDDANASGQRARMITRTSPQRCGQQQGGSIA